MKENATRMARTMTIASCFHAASLFALPSITPGYHPKPNVPLRCTRQLEFRQIFAYNRGVVPRKLYLWASLSNASPVNP